MDQQNTNSVWNLINELSTKKGITEIVINNPRTVFVEREGKFIQLNVNLTKSDMYGFINEVAAYNKKECNAETPIIDGSLPDGSRFNAIIEPFAHASPAITIRRYLKRIQNFDQSPDVFGLTPFWVNFLKAAVHARLNIVVSGGTGVGKTTLLNLLLNEIPHEERLVTIEDTLELSFAHPNIVRLEAGYKNLLSQLKVSARDLVKNSLRMRPDRIIIGETRGGELFDLLQAMNTGHDGSMTSIHSSSTGECFSRMETLYMMAGFDVPYHVVRRQIASAVDLVVQIARNRNGQRIVSHIAEVSGMEGNVIGSQTIAHNPEGQVISTGLPSLHIKKLHEHGELPLDYFSNAKR